ncbi:mitogen-activated protein kinase kinase kinase kinase 1-like [Strix aluco]|uniref:mitogen-activated protein kinase kinase kinase kinase 1-like n=1 Tax=Strix aluco TaxID=111821 RepID=UPI003DA2DA69
MDPPDEPPLLPRGSFLEQPPPPALVRCASGPAGGLGPPTPTRGGPLTASSDPALWIGPCSEDAPHCCPPRQRRSGERSLRTTGGGTPRPHEGSLFRKVFDGCPLRVTATTTWTHPSTQGLGGPPGRGRLGRAPPPPPRRISLLLLTIVIICTYKKT